MKGYRVTAISAVGKGPPGILGEKVELSTQANSTHLDVSSTESDNFVLIQDPVVRFHGDTIRVRGYVKSDTAIDTFRQIEIKLSLK